MKGTGLLVLRDKVSIDFKILCTGCLPDLQGTDSGNYIFKAPFVLQVHRYLGKHAMVQESTSMRQPSKTLLKAIAAILCFHLQVPGVSLASLQAVMELMCDKCIIRTGLFDFSTGTLLKLWRPRYGLPGARYY